MLLEYNEKSVLWGAIIGLILSLAFAVKVYNDPDLPAVANYLIILPTLFGICIYHLLNSNIKTRKLLEILNANKSNPTASELVFEGERIYPDSIVVQFKIIMSMIFVCFTINTKPHIYRGSKPWVNGLGYSMLSLVLGPWSHKGIGMTPATIIENFRLPERNTVQELCLRLEAWGKPVKIN